MFYKYVTLYIICQDHDLNIKNNSYVYVIM